MTFCTGFLVNAVFMNLGIGGILRELSRLAVIVGFLLIIIGGIQALIKKK